MEGLASQGCKGNKEEVQLHCRGRIQQDVHQTAAEVQLREGYTISLERPDRADRLLHILYCQTLALQQSTYQIHHVDLIFNWLFRDPNMWP